ncbi:MAG: polysaccharide lyase family 8 super-sandwich domain-containing protein [Bacteroidota bacterium]
MKLVSVVLVLALWNGVALAQDNAAFDSVANRIVYDMQSEVNDVKALDRNVSKHKQSIGDNRLWKDINYSDQSMALWSPALHLERVQDFALAFTNTHSSYFNSSELYGLITNQLRAWNEKNPICRNWWYNEINCPQILGQVILLLNSLKPLPATLQDSLQAKMLRGNMYKQTGANKLDVALHYLYSAVLTKNPLLMDTAVAQCFIPVTLTNRGEGLQYDYAYLQHGPQLAIASYGTTFLVGEYKVASYVRSTRWQLPEEKRKALAKFFNEVYLKATRGKYFDFSVLGRGFSRKGIGNLNTIVDMHSKMNLLQNSGFVNAGDVESYNDVVKRIAGTEPASYHVNPLHSQFFSGDYTLHARKEYLFTVRTNSVRTRRTETGNSENLLGRYMSDGATNIQRSGGEYFNIYPIWEYDKIPGITCRDYATDRPAIENWGQPGTTSFTGGVSDSLYGVNTYELDFDSVKARKAWFFFDKEIVCLGAGIQANTGENITTTINQCWSRDEIQKGDNESYWHDSIGYFLPEGGSAIFTNDEQKGTWYKINHSQPKDTVKGKVFKLWIDHGKQPKNAGYAYMVVPGLSKNAFMDLSPFKQVTIVSNTSSLQAVEHRKLKILQVVFYSAGTVTSGNTTLSVDKPCVVMLKNTGSKKPELCISDPTQKLADVKLTLNGKTMNCPLPQNEFAGATARFR